MDFNYFTLLFKKRFVGVAQRGTHSYGGPEKHIIANHKGIVYGMPIVCHVGVQGKIVVVAEFWL